jgi:hypothetical protein
MNSSNFFLRFATLCCFAREARATQRRSAKHRNNWSRPTTTRTRQTTKVLHASPVAWPNSARLVLAPARELLNRTLPGATPSTSGPETRSASQRPALSRTTAAVSQLPIQRPVPPQRRWLQRRPLRHQAQQRRKNRRRTKTHACLTLSTRNSAQCRRGANGREFWKLSPTLRQCVHQQHMSPNGSFLKHPRGKTSKQAYEAAQFACKPAFLPPRSACADARVPRAVLPLLQLCKSAPSAPAWTNHSTEPTPPRRTQQPSAVERASHRAWTAEHEAASGQL